MPITALDPKTALVVIDLLKGITMMPTVNPMNEVVGCCLQLVAAFRQRKLPTVLVSIKWAADGGDVLKKRTQAQGFAGPRQPDFFEYIDALKADPEHDILLQKRQWGAFYGTDLDLQLRRRGVTNIVMCGVATSIGVESTARVAWEHNYNLTFATDAMSDTNLEAQERAFNIIFPRLGELGSTTEVLEHLA